MISFGSRTAWGVSFSARRKPALIVELNDVLHDSVEQSLKLGDNGGAID